MSNLFSAFDLTFLSMNIETSLLVGVVLLLLFIGYKLINRSGNAIAGAGAGNIITSSFLLGLLSRCSF